MNASLEFQKANSAYNGDLLHEVRPVVRVGIAMGEVVVADDTVTGEGVVLAQRLEQLAEPGGVCIQGAVYETVPRRLPFDYENLGEYKLKGFDEPTRVYVVSEAGSIRKTGQNGTILRGAMDKPAIAILPFTNLSSDPEQEYFSDGLTEDVITSLSRYRELLVTALGSSWKFKENTADTTAIAKRLGVQYLLQGSARRAADKLRVTVRLIDGANGAQLWAETYDRKLTDIFAVQDELTQSIVGTFAGQLEDVSRKAALRKSITDATAYDLVLRARNCYRDWKGTKEDILKARELYENAIRQDRECARAFSGLADTYLAESLSTWTLQRNLARERAMEFAQKALAMDSFDSNAQLALANVYKRLDANYERALNAIGKAISLNPNDYCSYCAKSGMCVMGGNSDEAIVCASEAIRRNPLLPDNCLMIIGLAEYLAGRFETAIEKFRSLLHPYSETEAYVAACYAQLGRRAEAETAAASFRKLNAAERLFDAENTTKCWHNRWSTYWAAQDVTKLDLMLEGLCKATIVTD